MTVPTRLQNQESPERAVRYRVESGTAGHASVNPRRSRVARPVPELSLMFAAPPADAVPRTASGTGTTSRARLRESSPPPSVEASSGAGAKVGWRTAACEQSRTLADPSELQPVTHDSIASTTRPSSTGRIQGKLVAARREADRAGRTGAGDWPGSPSNRRATSADPAGRDLKSALRDPPERGSVADIQNPVALPTGQSPLGTPESRRGNVRTRGNRAARAGSVKESDAESLRRVRRGEPVLLADRGHTGTLRTRA